MSFIWPLMLYSLLLVPLFVIAYSWLLKRRARQTAALGMMGLLQTHSQQLRQRLCQHLPFAIFLLAITLLLVGLARPEMVIELPRVEGTVILAFDVSSSMIANDLEPSRMEAAKSAARTFVEKQPSTIQIGVVAFSNGGLIIQSPTKVQADVLAAIDRLSPSGGTSLGQGIFTSLNAIAGKPITFEEETLKGESALPIEYLGSAAIVLLSDGENTEQPDPLDIAQLAANAGVRIFPIGVGRREGTVVEIDGFNVVTVLDEALLQEIAGLTNGTYFDAEDETSLLEIYDNIDLKLTIKGDKMEITALIAGISLFLLLIGGALSILCFGRIP